MQKTIPGYGVRKPSTWMSHKSRDSEILNRDTYFAIGSAKSKEAELMKLNCEEVKIEDRGLGNSAAEAIQAENFRSKRNTGPGIPRVAQKGRA